MLNGAYLGPIDADMRKDAAATYHRIRDNLARAITGNGTAIRHLLAAFLTGGHVLLEDYPGTGKTTLAKALAASLNMHFNRIQCTPDLLPADILGVSIFNPKTNSFEVHKGPLFTDILLADEINRASPRTQSALLEAMAERQISLDTTTYRLSDGFFVIATQNPIEFQGTYPLPEAQLDRFALRLSLGYLAPDDELTMIRAQHAGHPLAELVACASAADLASFKRIAGAVGITDEILAYAVDLVAATRGRAEVTLGASPRASMTLVRCAQALAICDGLDFVTPDHVQELACPVIAHRLLIDPNARYSGLTAAGVVANLIAEIPVPR